MSNNRRRRRTVLAKVQILSESSYKCAHCGATLTKDTMTLDHVIPLDKNGADSVDNMCALCEGCNNFKGNQLVHPEVFYPYLKKEKRKALQAKVDHMCRHNLSENQRVSQFVSNEDLECYDNITKLKLVFKSGRLANTDDVKALRNVDYLYNRAVNGLLTKREHSAIASALCSNWVYLYENGALGAKSVVEGYFNNPKFKTQHWDIHLVPQILEIKDELRSLFTLYWIIEDLNLHKVYHLVDRVKGILGSETLVKLARISGVNESVILAKFFCLSFSVDFDKEG